MVGRLNWMPPPQTIPAIVLSMFAMGPGFCEVTVPVLPHLFLCRPSSCTLDYLRSGDRGLDSTR